MLTKYPTINHFVDDVLGLNNRLWASFDEVMGEGTSFLPLQTKPIIDSVEADGKIKYLIDLPGINKKEVSLTQEGNFLRIEAERADKHFRNQYSSSISIPHNAKPETLSASMEDGVLSIVFDVKSDADLVKKIEIGGGAEVPKLDT